MLQSQNICDNDQDARKIKGTNLFIHKILLSLQFLQGQPKYRCGAASKVITNYILKHFQTDGDVYSQVLSSLDEAVHYGFIEKSDKVYQLVGPVAQIQLLPCDSKSREEELARVRKIFSYEWNNCRTKKVCQPPQAAGLRSFLCRIRQSLFGKCCATCDASTSARAQRKLVKKKPKKFRLEREKWNSTNNCESAIQECALARRRRQYKTKKKVRRRTCKSPVKKSTLNTLKKRIIELSNRRRKTRLKKSDTSTLKSSFYSSNKKRTCKAPFKKSESSTVKKSSADVKRSNGRRKCKASTIKSDTSTIKKSNLNLTDGSSSNRTCTEMGRQPRRNGFYKTQSFKREEE